MKLSLAVCLASACLLVGLLVGRALAPERVKVEVKERIVEKRIEVAAAASSASAATETREVVRWKERRIYLPGRIEVVRETERGTAAETRTESAAATRSEAIAEREHARSEVRIVEAPRRWALGGAYGLDLGGGKHWGGYVRYRLLGPFELGVVADVPARAGMVTFGVVF